MTLREYVTKRDRIMASAWREIQKIVDKFYATKNIPEDPRARRIINALSTKERRRIPLEALRKVGAETRRPYTKSSLS